jgi:hypothetical protein
VAGEGTNLAELLNDDAGDATDLGNFRFATFPGTRRGVAEVEAIDGVGKIAHEIAAAQFAIGRQFETEFFLLVDNSPNVEIFEAPQTGGIRRRVLSSLQQLRGPQKTPYVVGPALRWHFLLVSPGGQGC